MTHSADHPFSHKRHFRFSNRYRGADAHETAVKFVTRTPQFTGTEVAGMAIRCRKSSVAEVFNPSVFTVWSLLRRTTSLRPLFNQSRRVRVFAHRRIAINRSSLPASSGNELGKAMAFIENHWQPMSYTGEALGVVRIKDKVWWKCCMETAIDGALTPAFDSKLLFSGGEALMSLFRRGC